KVSADPETAAHLRRILDNARLVKDSVSRVGRAMTPPVPDAGLSGDRPGMVPGGARPATRGGTDPVAVPADGAGASGPGGGPPLAGKGVLVVDTDERVRKQAHLLLTRLGATTETTGSAKAGLAMAADNRYDAIFLDVKPPDMGGYECYRRFRAANPG